MIKQLIRSLTPKFIQNSYSDYIHSSFNKRMKDKDTGEIFNHIYLEKRWGAADDEGFSSGSGSREKHITEPYVEAVTTLLQSYDKKPNVVDLGCGDFAIGSRLRPFCNQYIGCDVASSVIERNQKRFADMDVTFMVKNLATDALPEGDIVFIRQVLQHLSNDLISKGLETITATYPYLLLTEDIPIGEFNPNKDIPTGADIRLRHSSGIDITKAPFNVKPLETGQICDVILEDSRIVSTLYRFK